MEMKQEERVVVTKPVASRPNSSNFRSFSELLARAVDVSPSTTCSETAVAAIRPKAVNFKPSSLHPPTGLFQLQAETSGCTPSNVVYKPHANLRPKQWSLH